MDGKLFTFFILKTFENISLPIDSRNMYLPPFDASRHDDSNELRFIFLRSLNGEISSFN
jgi:hypothetical protein